MVSKLAEMFETMGDAQVAQAREQSAALVEVAKSVQAQASSFNTWLESFKITEAPTTTVVREEDEWAAEQKRIADRLGVPVDDPSVPEEFRLALALHKEDFLNDVRND